LQRKAELEKDESISFDKLRTLSNVETQPLLLESFNRL
jgi:hypothetical protein